VVDRVRAAFGVTSAEGLPVRVVAATTVAVDASLEVISRDPGIGAAVRAALAGLSAERPSRPLLASHVLAAATAVPGAEAARILRWARRGERATTATALAAARASWRAGGAPRGAELLVVDGHPELLDIVTTSPAEAPRP
jgi:hypothetical protein